MGLICTAVSHPPRRFFLDWSSYLEMQGDQTEDERLEVLHQVVKDSQAFRIFALVHVDERSNLGSLKRDVLAA